MATCPNCSLYVKRDLCELEIYVCVCEISREYWSYDNNSLIQRAYICMSQIITNHFLTLDINRFLDKSKTKSCLLKEFMLYIFPQEAG